MNKEIVALLKDLRTFSDGDCIYEISSQGCELLFDYITDLQEENKRLNNQYDLMENSLDEKQEVIDKAIEYLESYNTDFKNSKFGEAPISLRELGDLLDILRGEDNDKNIK